MLTFFALDVEKILGEGHVSQKRCVGIQDLYAFGISPFQEPLQPEMFNFTKCIPVLGQLQPSSLFSTLPANTNEGKGIR